jgi:hypothetical protein
MSRDAHERAVAGFLHEYLPRRQNDARWPWMAERDRLQLEIRSLEALVAERTDQLAILKRSRLLRIGRLLRRLTGLPAPY